MTGLCNRQSCPLANSNYATVREIDGAIYLVKKTVERSHTPAKQWERIRLADNPERAQGQIEEALEHWPRFLQAKCADRLVRIREYLGRMRRIQLNPHNQPLLQTRAGKVVKREAKREAKAKKAAQLEATIERELLERLQKGVYGDIYNLHQSAFERALEKGGAKPDEEELDEDLEDLEEAFVEDDEEEEENQDGVEYLSEFEESEAEMIDDDLEDLVGKQRPKRRGPYVEIEYEEDISNSKINSNRN